MMRRIKRGGRDERVAARLDQRRDRKRGGGRYACATSRRQSGRSADMSGTMRCVADTCGAARSWFSCQPQRTLQPTVDVDRLKRHIMFLSTNVLSQGHSRKQPNSGRGQTVRRDTHDGRPVPGGEQVRRPAPSARSTYAKRRGLVLNHRAPTWDLKRDNVQVWPLRQWERLTSQRARGDRPLVRSRRR